MRGRRGDLCLGPFTHARVAPTASQPGSPRASLQDQTPPWRCHQQNCQPLPQSVSSSGTRAAEQLVGGIGAVIRSVFPRTDNPIPQGSVSRCFSSLSPEIHLWPPTGAHGPQLRRQVDVGDLRSPVLNKSTVSSVLDRALGESSTILEPLRPCSGICAWPREGPAGRRTVCKAMWRNTLVGQAAHGVGLPPSFLMPLKSGHCHHPGSNSMVSYPEP